MPLHEVGYPWLWEERVGMELYAGRPTMASISLKLSVSLSHICLKLELAFYANVAEDPAFERI